MYSMDDGNRRTSFFAAAVRFFADSMVQFFKADVFENPKGKRQKHMEGEKNGHYAWDFRYYDWYWNIVADEKICPVKKRNTP